jgi:hypothetical protein
LSETNDISQVKYVVLHGHQKVANLSASHKAFEHAPESEIHHMKIARLSCVCVFALTSLLAFADDNRTWTDAATGRKLEGIIESKSNDGSEVKVKRKDNGKTVTLKSASLVGEDQTFIKGWTLPAKGIVLEHQSILQQSKGGFGNIIDEMGILFAPFDEAKDDQAAHPEAVIYEGTRRGRMP